MKQRLALAGIIFGLWLSALAMAEELQSIDPAAADYEQALREKMGAAERIAREELDRLHETINNTDSADERNVDGFVLSTEVRSFEDIPASVDREIQLIRRNLRALIFQVATDIERSGSSPGVQYDNEQGIHYAELPEAAVEKYQNIMDAKEQNNISVRSVQIAIRLLASINDQLMADARAANDVQVKRRLYITQAAYIFEMADIVLDLLNTIQLDGKDTLQHLSAENNNRINERLTDIDTELARIQAQQQAGVISSDDAESLQRSYQHIVAANRTSLQAWGDLMSRVERQEDWLEQMKRHSVSIELKRNAARHQLNTLRDIVLVGELAPLIDMDDLVATIQNIELLELNDEAVYGLLGFDPEL